MTWTTMKLINKTILIISLTTLVLVAGLYFSANHIILSSFSKIEKNEAEKELDQYQTMPGRRYY